MEKTPIGVARDKLHDKLDSTPENCDVFVALDIIIYHLTIILISSYPQDPCMVYLPRFGLIFMV